LCFTAIEIRPKLVWTGKSFFGHFFRVLHKHVNSTKNLKNDSRLKKTKKGKTKKTSTNEPSGGREREQQQHEIKSYNDQKRSQRQNRPFRRVDCVFSDHCDCSELK
jgi:hypothetical protein